MSSEGFEIKCTGCLKLLQRVEGLEKKWSEARDDYENWLKARRDKIDELQAKVEELQGRNNQLELIRKQDALNEDVYLAELKKLREYCTLTFGESHPEIKKCPHEIECEKKDEQIKELEKINRIKERGYQQGRKDEREECLKIIEHPNNVDDNTESIAKAMRDRGKG